MVSDAAVGGGCNGCCVESSDPANDITTSPVEISSKVGTGVVKGLANGLARDLASAVARDIPGEDPVGVSAIVDTIGNGATGVIVCTGTAVTGRGTTDNVGEIASEGTSTNVMKLPASVTTLTACSPGAPIGTSSNHWPSASANVLATLISSIRTSTKALACDRPTKRQIPSCNSAIWLINGGTSVTVGTVLGATAVVAGISVEARVAEATVARADVVVGADTVTRSAAAIDGPAKVSLEVEALVAVDEVTVVDGAE